MPWTLDSVVKSPNPAKKYRANFSSNDEQGVTRRSYDFGAAGMSDYTMHHDLTRRNRYISRHLKDLRGDPLKPGYLSMFILWNKPTFDGSLKDYRRRLHEWNTTSNFPIDIPKYTRTGTSPIKTRYNSPKRC